MSRIAISSTVTNKVFVYDGDRKYLQTITTSSSDVNFGNKVVLSSDATYLFVASSSIDTGGSGL